MGDRIPYTTRADYFSLMTSEVSQKFIDDFTEAEKLCNENNLHASLEKYMALLKQQPNHVFVLNNIGLVYEKLGDFENSIAYYKKCNDLKPDQAVLIHNLANAYIQAEKWEDALPLLENIIHTDFQNESNTEKLALCLFNTRTKEETRDFIDSVIARYPENQTLNRLLGRSLLYLDCHSEGLKYLRKGSGFIELNSEGVRYLN